MAILAPCLTHNNSTFQRSAFVDVVRKNPIVRHAAAQTFCVVHASETSSHGLMVKKLTYVFFAVASVVIISTTMTGNYVAVHRRRARHKFRQKPKYYVN